MALAGLALGAVAVGAGVIYLLESPTSPVPYATSTETPHEAGPLKGFLQAIPDLMWPENKNPFGQDGTYYDNRLNWEQYPNGQFGVTTNRRPAAENELHDDKRSTYSGRSPSRGRAAVYQGAASSLKSHSWYSPSRSRASSQIALSPRSGPASPRRLASPRRQNTPRKEDRPRNAGY